MNFTYFPAEAAVTSGQGTIGTSFPHQQAARLGGLNAEEAYWKNSAGWPVSRSMRLAMGGCVENRFPKFTPNSG